jgi:hypothetical protein
MSASSSALSLDDDVALLGEHPGDGVGFGEVAADLSSVWRSSPTVRFLLSVRTSMMTAAPPGRTLVLGFFVRDARLFAVPAGSRA